jgi:hypothetical protein
VNAAIVRFPAAAVTEPADGVLFHTNAVPAPEEGRVLLQLLHGWISIELYMTPDEVRGLITKLTEAADRLAAREITR